MHIDKLTKIDIITTLSDPRKINFIDKIKIEKYKVEVIKSLNYENRVNMLDVIKKPSDRRDIVETLIDEADSDEKRIEILNITNKYGIKDLIYDYVFYLLYFFVWNNNKRVEKYYFLCYYLLNNDSNERKSYETFFCAR